MKKELQEILEECTVVMNYVSKSFDSKDKNFEFPLKVKQLKLFECSDLLGNDLIINANSDITLTKLLEKPYNELLSISNQLRGYVAIDVMSYISSKIKDYPDSINTKVICVLGNCSVGVQKVLALGGYIVIDMGTSVSNAKLKEKEQLTRLMREKIKLADYIVVTSPTMNTRVRNEWGYAKELGKEVFQYGEFKELFL